MLIGLTGRAGSGKSTVAAYLRANGFEILSFAAPLKRMVLEAFELPETVLYGTQADKEARIERLGYSGRELAQRIGTAARNHLGSDVWLRACLGKMQPDRNYVIEDLRYRNEAQAVLAADGWVWRLVCPDRVSSDPGTHPSEAEVDLIEPTLEIASTREAGDLLERAAEALAYGKIHARIAEFKGILATRPLARRA